jgi:hypothetical protein
MTDTDKKNLRFIAENIANRQCVLFLGAGVNMGTEKNEVEYPKNLRPPTGSELTKILLAELQSEPEDPNDGFSKEDKNNLNLSRVAQYYELKKNGRLGLANALKKHILNGKVPSPKLCELAELPFEYIITTNYDVLFEEAFKKTHNGAEPHVRSYRPERGSYRNDREQKILPVKASEISAAKPFLFKIHGDINDEQSMVITDEDYIHFVQRMRDTGEINPIPEVFDNALARKSILFIGYRLMDYNLRLLFKTIRWGHDINTMPKNYSIDPYPDHLIHTISDSNYQTRFIVSDLWHVVPELKKMVFEILKPSGI